jgi:tetratricopeptide (TPR) repeat protein
MDASCRTLTGSVMDNSSISQSLMRRGWEKVGKQDYRGAITDFTQAMRLDPKAVYPYFSRGTLYSRLGDHARAFLDFTQGLKVDPTDHGLYYGRALAREQLGDQSGALEDFRNVLTLKPEDALSYMVRGIARSKTGDKQGAIEDLELSKNLHFEACNMGDYQKLLNILKEVQKL